MPLVGTLRDLSLANLVQLQCSEQNEAQVSLAYREHQGKLVFSNGELIYASVDNKFGDAAVYVLLTWEDGDFQVSSEHATFERNIETSWGSLLLEGLRLADEQRAERDVVDRSRLVCRYFIADDEQPFVLAVITPPNATYRRVTTRAVREIQAAWADGAM